MPHETIQTIRELDLDRQYRADVRSALESLQKGLDLVRTDFAIMARDNASEHGEVKERLASMEAKFARALEEANARVAGRDVMLRVAACIILTLCGVIAGAKASAVGLIKALGF
jgi:hypothetical protein